MGSDQHFPSASSRVPRIDDRNGEVAEIAHVAGRQSGATGNCNAGEAKTKQRTEKPVESDLETQKLAPRLLPGALTCRMRHPAQATGSGVTAPKRRSRRAKTWSAAMKSSRVKSGHNLSLNRNSE